MDLAIFMDDRTRSKISLLWPRPCFGANAKQGQWLFDKRPQGLLLVLLPEPAIIQLICINPEKWEIIILAVNLH